MFTVSVKDERGLVAAGKVTRVIVDRERFLEKCGSAGGSTAAAVSKRRPPQARLDDLG